MRVEHAAKDADRTDAVTDRLSGLESGFEERVVGVAETYGYVGPRCCCRCR